jgi:hypothetical protein
MYVVRLGYAFIMALTAYSQPDVASFSLVCRVPTTRFILWVELECSLFYFLSDHWNRVYACKQSCRSKPHSIRRSPGSRKGATAKSTVNLGLGSTSTIMGENKATRAPSLGDYKYEALEKRQIRVVHLYPTKGSGLMYCTIERVSIDDNPTFEALSYTWGTSPGRYQIQVGASVLSIGKNLAVALRTLSSGDKLRTIWIDAICIDQSNAAERNHQVRFMKDIYTRASSVVIWLGEAADGSDALLDYLDTLDASSALVEHRAWIDYEEEWSWDKGVSFQQPPVAQETVDALLCRPWFGRVWIQQEAAVNAHTKVQCGSKTVTWDQLFSLVWDYQKPSGEGFAKDQFSIDALRSSVLITLIQSYRYPDISTLLLDILRDCTYAGATDPRDRIFGIQNLARDPDLDKLLLEPDYNDDVVVVYTKLAKRYLATQGPFILGWAGRNNQYFPELPSWAPD